MGGPRSPRLPTFPEPLRVHWAQHIVVVTPKVGCSDAGRSHSQAGGESPRVWRALCWLPVLLGILICFRQFALGHILTCALFVGLSYHSCTFAEAFFIKTQDTEECEG